MQDLIRNHGYETLRFAGLFNLPIPLRFARHAPDFTFGIGVSTINTIYAQILWPSFA
jgi:hypothetical protein